MMQASKLFGWQRTTDAIPMQQELIIEPGQSIAHYWRDLWRYSGRTTAHATPITVCL